MFIFCLCFKDSPLSPSTRARVGTLSSRLEYWRAAFPTAVAVLPVSAIRGEGTDTVLERVMQILPEHPPFFPKDQLSDLPEKFFAAEMVRSSFLNFSPNPFSPYVTPHSPHISEFNSIFLKGRPS